jgi:hypothetical protein
MHARLLVARLVRGDMPDGPPWPRTPHGLIDV